MGKPRLTDALAGNKPVGKGDRFRSIDREKFEAGYDQAFTGGGDETCSARIASCVAGCPGRADGSRRCTMVGDTWYPVGSAPSVKANGVGKIESTQLTCHPLQLEAFNRTAKGGVKYKQCGPVCIADAPSFHAMETEYKNEHRGQVLTKDGYRDIVPQPTFGEKG